MHVVLDSQLEVLVREEVEAGLYPNSVAVLREALRLLDARDRHRQWLKDALAKGAKGEAVPLTPELLEELHRSAIRRANAGELPSADVCP
jgi:putative addiction module CopG family antidote